MNLADIRAEGIGSVNGYFTRCGTESHDGQNGPKFANFAFTFLTEIGLNLQTTSFPAVSSCLPTGSSSSSQSLSSFRPVSRSSRNPSTCVTSARSSSTKNRSNRSAVMLWNGCHMSRRTDATLSTFELSHAFSNILRIRSRLLFFAIPCSTFVFRFSPRGRRSQSGLYVASGVWYGWEEPNEVRIFVERRNRQLDGGRLERSIQIFDYSDSDNDSRNKCVFHTFMRTILQQSRTSTSEQETADHIKCDVYLSIDMLQPIRRSIHLNSMISNVTMKHRRSSQNRGIRMIIYIHPNSSTIFHPSQYPIPPFMNTGRSSIIGGMSNFSCNSCKRSRCFPDTIGNLLRIIG